MRSTQVAAIVGALFASAAGAGEWRPITTELLRTAKPGYGGLSGVVSDPHTGYLYVNVSDRGIYRSTSQGGEWQHLGETFKGRTEWPGCLLIDPRLVPCDRGRRLYRVTCRPSGRPATAAGRQRGRPG